MSFISMLFASYTHLFFLVGGVASLVFVVGLYFIFHRYRDSLQHAAIHDEMMPIAGEDVIATQLDLARAYLETGSADLAKTILKAVIKHGSAIHREEAKQLLSSV